ncbi:hypothetical protein TrispH2_002003 [Trichoplax sp. H2]|nr:hypothetical protein TrispH2_002003 [Trichoplax sp. H2]|eukprot:RDD46500.1 hypothetical protein TrispH2_002003 [Trichoplax sp. H2]
MSFPGDSYNSGNSEIASFWHATECIQSSFLDSSYGNSLPGMARQLVQRFKRNISSTINLGISPIVISVKVIIQRHSQYDIIDLSHNCYLPNDQDDNN